MTYIRVVVLSYDPARQVEIESFIALQMVPKIRQVPGFRRWTGAGDRAGHAVTISEWDTLEQAQTGVPTALGLAQSFDDLGLRQDALYVYEVTAVWTR